MDACAMQSSLAAQSSSPGWIFTQLIQTLLAINCAIENDHRFPPDQTPRFLNKEINPKYDFVIVGGGAAGSVLAHRLSEVPHWSVLLIERGEDPSLASDVPGLFTMVKNSAEDYRYAVERNENYCRGYRDRRCYWSKGKALGGSSVINAMLHVRGTDRDYDSWEEAGNPGWGFKDVLPYFLKSENYHPEVAEKFGRDLYGTGGPLTLRPFNYSQSDFQEVVLAAARDLGIPNLPMINGREYIGFGKAFGALDNGIRKNDARAFLTPIADRPNLHILKMARASQVTFSSDNVANGVDVVLRNGDKIHVEARKEVILSAGSIGTPHLLMLSGIGEREELTKHDIQIVADLPVGKNLQDHLVWLGVFMSYEKGQSKPVTPVTPLDWAYEFLMHRSGELSGIGGIDFIGFVNTRDPTAKYPNIQYHMSYIPQNNSITTAGFAHAFDFGEEFAGGLQKLNQENNLIMIAPTLLKPKSTGHLELKSKDPSDDIKIHTAYLENPDDLEELMSSIKVIRQLEETKTFKDRKIRLCKLEIKECSDYSVDSDDYWRCNLRHTASSIFHAVGTVKMGPRKDKSAVVDSNLKVHSVSRLRVIDASIMPTIPSGNTHSPTLMIAEKGSDLIKDEWLRKDEL